jgi:hypothetical protein
VSRFTQLPTWVEVGEGCAVGGALQQRLGHLASLRVLNECRQRRGVLTALTIAPCMSSATSWVKVTLICSNAAASRPAPYSPFESAPRSSRRSFSGGDPAAPSPLAQPSSCGGRTRRLEPWRRMLDAVGRRSRPDRSADRGPHGERLSGRADRSTTRTRCTWPPPPTPRAASNGPADLSDEQPAGSEWHSVYRRGTRTGARRSTLRHVGIDLQLDLRADRGRPPSTSGPSCPQNVTTVPTAGCTKASGRLRASWWTAFQPVQ